jgi:hypothetical protein
MATATFADARAMAGVHYEVLFRASIATRFAVRDRWVLAGSFATEAAAQRKFAALNREFPSDQVRLRLVRSEADAAGEHYTERVLARREPAPPAGHRFLRQSAEPRVAFRARQAGERPRRTATPAPPPSGLAWLWPMAIALALAALVFVLMTN